MWRASLLRQLYTETKRALRRGLENPVDREEQIRRTQSAALDILVRGGNDPAYWRRQLCPVDFHNRLVPPSPVGHPVIEGASRNR